MPHRTFKLRGKKRDQLINLCYNNKFTQRMGPTPTVESWRKHFISKGLRQESRPLKWELDSLGVSWIIKIRDGGKGAAGR